MKKWYHTGTYSLDNPEVRQFEEGQEPVEFGYGLFRTFQDAKDDLINLLDSDIANLRDCLRNARRIKKE